MRVNCGGRTCTAQTADGGRPCTRQTGDGGRTYTRQSGDGGRTCTRQTGDGGRTCTRQTGDGGRPPQGRPGQRDYGLRQPLCALDPDLDGDRLRQWCQATAVIIAVQHLYRRPPDATTTFPLGLAGSA